MIDWTGFAFDRATVDAVLFGALAVGIIAGAVTVVLAATLGRR